MSVHRLLYVTFTILLIALSEPYEVTAQQLRYNFKNYTPSEGLPSSEVYQVLQDSYHYMWFATDHGICRYNGYEFKSFNLADNSILGIYEDYKKRIWAYSFSGRLFYYENGEFKDYEWNEKLIQALKPAVINAVFVDSSETVHISASGPNYFKISRRGEIKNFVQLSKRAICSSFQTSPNDFFTSILSFPVTLTASLDVKEDATEILIKETKKAVVAVLIPHTVQPERCRVKKMDDGTVFFYSKDCIVKFTGNGSYLFEKTLYTIDDIEYVQGNYYLATGDGLIIKNPDGRIVDHYFKGIHITSVQKDYEGGLWISSLTNGVFYLNPMYTLHLSENNEILRNKFKSLLMLNQSTILASVNRNEILQIKVNQSIVRKSLDVSDIVSLYRYNDDNVIVGSSLKVFDTRTWFVEKKQQVAGLGLIIMPCNSNIVKRGDTLYSGTMGMILKFRYTDLFQLDKAIKTNFRVSKIFLNHNQKILVGNQFGLWYYRDSSLYAYDRKKKIFESRITDINEYAQQYLCVGTRGKGVLFMTKDSLYEINEGNGLVSNNIRKILVENNRIWLASNRGISILNIKSISPFIYSVKNLSVQDGLLSNEVNDMVDQNGQVIIATNSGVSFLDKSKVLSKVQHRLPFYLTNVTVNGTSVNLEKLKNLDYKSTNVFISFDALNYSSPGANEFRYRLKGFDTSWIYTSDRSIQFNPLPYGKFKLEIQAKKEFDTWKDVDNVFSVEVNCRPPFWTEIWFYALMSVLFGLFSFVFFRKRLTELKKRQAEKENLRQRITETEQMALRSQMNPHFIFNCLNSIQQYVIERDVEGANKFISGFSKLIRQTLEFSSKDKITLEEEISYLTNYLELEAARMEGKFKYEVIQNCQHRLSEIFIPPMLLQPYIENSLRHGIKYLKGNNGFIKMKFIERNEILECVIEDNGIGRKQAMILKSNNPIEYQSRGMTLTAERIKLINQSKQLPIQILIEDIVNNDGNINGTKVTLTFPV